jgi:serine protease inhibitor
MKWQNPTRLLAFATALLTACAPAAQAPPEPSAPPAAVSSATQALPDAGAPDATLASADAGDGAAAEAPPEPMVPPSLADSINLFARDLHKELAKTPGNLFYSPLSIHLALTMTWAGARGKTAEEMAKVLHVRPGDTRVHEEYAKLVAALGSEPKGGAPEIRIANRLWVQNDFELVPEFVALTRDRYGAPIGRLDFFAQPEASRVAINAWVATRTKNHIEELLPEGSIHPQVRVVITDAIYLKAAWASPFPEENTRDDRFFVNGVTAQAVPTMHGDVGARYVELDDAQVIELPYARGGGADLAMVIVLPKGRNGLGSVEKRFARSGATALFRNERPRIVTLSLPRFTGRLALELKPVLAKLGMPLAFTGKADFSALSRHPPLVIDEVYHQAFFRTDEKGSEAAAGTAVVMAVSISGGPSPIEVRVDHPFLVFLRDRRSGVILFGGRVVAPGSQG